MNVYILHSYERLSSVTGSFNGLRNVLVIYFCRRQSDPSCLWIWKSFLNRSVSFVTSTHLSLRVIYLSSCYLIYLITRYISFGLYIQQILIPLRTSHLSIYHEINCTVPKWYNFQNADRSLITVGGSSRTHNYQVLFDFV